MGKKTREEDDFIECIVFGNAVDQVSLVSVHAEFKPKTHHQGGAFPIAVT